MFSSSGGAARTLVTETFTANQTWTAPKTTSQIEAASGYGAAGAPAHDYVVQRYSRTTVTYNRNTATGETTSYNQGITYGSGAPPGNYCDPETPTPSGVTYNCYDFADASYVDSTSPTTGADTTGFGKTFPGGYGGPASVTTYATPFAITPGGAYSLVIPSGGSLTISYYK